MKNTPTPHSRSAIGSLKAGLLGLAALAAATLATIALCPAVASADYQQVGNFAQSGNGEQLWASTGAAINVSGAGGVEAGSVYTTAGGRVSRFGPKGEIKEVWGWGAIASGPDLPNQVNTLTLSAASGTYELTAKTAVGHDEYTHGSKILTNVKTEVGAFHVGDVISGNMPLPPGTTIVAIGDGTVELSAAITGIYDSGLPRTIFAQETTAPIPYDASAAELQQAMLALPAFGPGDLSVTGGPGDATGSAPYEIAFEGAYTGSPVNIESNSAGLAGGSPSSAAAVATTVAASTPGFQRCRPASGDTCAMQQGFSGEAEQEGIGHFKGPKGIAVDQSTGYVYVRNGIARRKAREHNLIEVFSADGSQVIARFGDAAAEGESVDEGPEKLHDGSTPIAVDGSGRVYLGDNRTNGEVSEPPEPRVLCFRPESPGDYEHYVYCGRSQDIELEGVLPERLALDDAGHIYVANQEFLEELSLAEPAAPLCTYATHGQLRSMTVNPLTGEVLYFNGNPKSKAGVYRLNPCDPEAGTFEAAQAVAKTSPLTQEIVGLAFNPTLAWGPNRPPGTLYGADYERHPAETPPLYGLGYIFAPAEVHPPAVLSESVSGIRTASAILRAEIDPHGYGTHYAFQYLSEAEYEANEPSGRFAGATEAPLGGAQIGSGAVGHVAASVSGLDPDTAYRFRVVASSGCDEETGEPCLAEGEALAFSTYPLTPPGLPDHRAYELVSPVQKNGGEVLPAAPGLGSCEQCKPSSLGITFPMQSSPDGEAVAYEGQPFSPEGAVNYDSYVSRRSSAGWQTTGLIPALPPVGVDLLAFDPTLEHSLLGPDQSTLEIQSAAEPGSRTPLVSEAPPNRTDDFRLAYGGHSADFSRQFFAANDSLTGETPFAPEPPDPGFSGKDLYEWHEGQLTLVNVLPGDTTVSTGASFASRSPDAHAISADGTRVFWEDEAGDLFVRTDGELSTQVHDPGTFLQASADGTEVLLSDGCLYSLHTEACTDLSEGQGGFLGLAGSGEEGEQLSHLYFVDTAVLPAAAPNERGQSPQTGRPNLYSWSEGGLEFLATLLASDGTPGGLLDWAAVPSQRTAEASPGGRYLAFASTARLTGYDNVGPCAIETVIPPGGGQERFIVDGPCSEAFLYDSEDGRLLCASCNPTGQAPRGKTYLRLIAGSSEQLPQPRYLTDEGRLYFDSADSLSARDTNEGVEDVYEFEPQGAGKEGTCQRQAGCDFLISAGSEAVDSNLIAVDETGKNVFFDTRDKLTLKDKDELLDLYDAREGGGIAAETEVARGECQGESCQAPVSAPDDPTPGSSTFEGAGNVKEEVKAKRRKHAKRHKRHRARAAKRHHGGAK